MAIEYTGSLQGKVRAHTPETLAATWLNAYVVLPNAGGAPKVGTVEEFKGETKAYPAVVFCHGSSGVNPQIKIFAQWLADALRVAVVVPDSMQTEDRLTYSSPVPAADYEIIHKMRSQELALAMMEIKHAPWFDGRAIIAGTSEGGVTAARYQADEKMIQEKGRMIFSWSCEDNYHVESHNTHLDNPEALGYAGKVLANNPNAEIVLLPGAPHTLMNLPQARDAVQAFIIRVFRS